MTMSAMIDWAFFKTQTGAEAALQNDVLDLFVAQVNAVLDLVRTPAKCEPRAHAALFDALHQLKGSARSLGAFKLGDAIEKVETRAANSSDSMERSHAVLLATLNQTRRAAAGFIAARRGTPLANMSEHS